MNVHRGECTCVTSVCVILCNFGKRRVKIGDQSQQQQQIFFKKKGTSTDFFIEKSNRFKFANYFGHLLLENLSIVNLCVYVRQLAR
jgi:hypothetical protein